MWFDALRKQMDTQVARPKLLVFFVLNGPQHDFRVDNSVLTTDVRFVAGIWNLPCPAAIAQDLIQGVCQMVRARGQIVGNGVVLALQDVEFVRNIQRG